MVHGADAVAGQGRPRVFISYAHDDEAHITQVEKLYELLRTEGGLDAKLDLYAGVQPQDWPRWMQQQYAHADYVLVVASPAYKLRGDHEERDGAGLGVAWETGLLTTELYENYRAWFHRVLLVLLPGRSEKELPAFLGAVRISRFPVPTLDAVGIERLVRYMTGQPERVEPPMGPIPVYGTRPSPLSGPSPSGHGGGEAAPGAASPGEGCAGTDEGSGGLDESAWQQLAAILGGVTPPRWAEQAYQVSFGAAGSPGRAAAPSVPVGDLDLYDWAQDLGERRHIPGTVPKAVVFAHALAVGYAAGESPAERLLARALDSWVDRFLGDPGPSRLPPVPRIGRAEATLTVRLVEHPQRPDAFYAEVWRRTTDGRRPERLRPQTSEAPDTVDLEGARLLLEGCLRPDALGAGVRLQRIEFAVSDGLLEEAFDQWEVRIRRDLRILGKVYEVVVRCLDQRWGADLTERWSSRWRWLTRRGGSGERAAAWVGEEHTDCLDDLVGEWCETDHPVCVAVTMSQAQDGVAAALDAGMPVVVWQRESHRDRSDVPSLSELLPIGDVSGLPLDVTKLRRNRNVCGPAQASVVLLWDDPDHPVGADPLSDANLIA
jgi:hypothetical protein